MAVARKSAVYTKGSWLRRDSLFPLRKRGSARLGSAALGASKLAAKTAPVSSKKQSHSSKNSSVSSTNEAIMPKLVKELGTQQVLNLNRHSKTPQQSPRVGFFRLPVMPSSGAAPLLLLRLYALHRYSSVVAFLLVATTLAVYGWSVYTQELWSQAFRRLQSLQRHERLLTTTNATLKNKMAEEAERPAAGLVAPTPEGTIFLSPTTDSLNPASPTTTTTPNSQTQQQKSLPLGY